MAANQSRRTFVKTAGTTLMVAGLAGMGLVGCSSQGAPSGTGSTGDASSDGFEWDEETDVLVVGSGLAGVAAAVTVAKEDPNATCLLIEKGQSPLGNGNSPFSTGIFMYTTEDREQDALEYLKELRENEETGTPDDVLEAFASEIVHNLDWIKELGATDADLTIIPGTADLVCFPEYPELEHSASCDYAAFGAEGSKWDHVTKFMNDVLNDLPAITLKTQCPLTALVQDPSTKTVLGGIYSDGSTEVRVKANKGVIMTCGGFESNPGMMANYFSEPTVKPVAAQENTGDGHRICTLLGAAEWHMNSGAGFWNTIRKLDDSGWGKYSGTGSINTALGITVASNGRRFYMDWDACGTIDWDQYYEGVPLNASVGSHHGHMQFGGDWHLLPMPKISWFVCDQTAIDNGVFALQGEDPVAEGFGYKADTLEELAAQADLPAEQLIETVDLWNSYCENGKDPAFFRPPNTLTPIKTAPFYIMMQQPQMLNTDGGPVRSAKAEIIDVEGNPIPHLYSAGEFGSVWSSLYQGGGNLGECLAFGRIAARSALAN